ncbi:MAG: hypothetical protein Q7R48_00345 [bacterium]|nr:hypothetical protein [bacterium]
MDQPDMQALEKKIDALQRSIDRLNTIFLWTLIITVVLFVLPLLGLVFAIPQFLSSYGNVL